MPTLCNVNTSYDTTCPLGVISQWDVVIKATGTIEGVVDPGASPAGTTLATFTTNNDSAAFTPMDPFSNPYLMGAWTGSTMSTGIIVDQEQLVEDIEVCLTVTDLCGTSDEVCDTAIAAPPPPLLSVPNTITVGSYERAVFDNSTDYSTGDMYFDIGAELAGGSPLPAGSYIELEIQHTRDLDLQTATWTTVTSGVQLDITGGGILADPGGIYATYYAPHTTLTNWTPAQFQAGNARLTLAKRSWANDTSQYWDGATWTAGGTTPNSGESLKNAFVADLQYNSGTNYESQAVAIRYNINVCSPLSCSPSESIVFEQVVDYMFFLVTSEMGVTFPFVMISYRRNGAGKYVSMVSYNSCGDTTLPAVAPTDSTEDDRYFRYYNAAGGSNCNNGIVSNTGVANDGTTSISQHYVRGFTNDNRFTFVRVLMAASRTAYEPNVISNPNPVYIVNRQSSDSSAGWSNTQMFLDGVSVPFTTEIFNIANYGVYNTTPYNLNIGQIYRHRIEGTSLDAGSWFVFAEGDIYLTPVY